MIGSLTAGAWRLRETSELDRRDHLLTMLFGAWLMIGLFVDGWAHTNLTSLETFFTPWHAIFYAGFGATAAWMLICVRRSGAIPVGYGAGLVGLAMFAVGGVGDMVWHLIFGIEQNVAALVSPTHVLLFVGMLLILSSPLRAAWTTPGDDAPTFGRFLPALLSLVLSSALCAFWLTYLSPFDTYDTLPRRAVSLATIADPVINAELRSATWRAGLASFYTMTAFMVAPLLLSLHRWRLPFGTATAMFTVTGVLLTSLWEFRLAPLIGAAVVTGVATDVMIRRLRPSPERRLHYWLFGALVPLVLWTLTFATIVLVFGTWWAPELISGAIAVSVMIGAGLAVLMAPPARPSPVGGG